EGERDHLTKERQAFEEARAAAPAPTPAPTSASAGSPSPSPTSPRATVPSVVQPAPNAPPSSPSRPAPEIADADISLGNACDRLAANPSDPQRNPDIPGVSFSQL